MLIFETIIELDFFVTSRTYIGMGNKSTDDFWRICRAVSTEGRLRLLWFLFEAGELSVRELAFGLEISEPVASVQLKILFLAGLIRFRREKMNVFYRPEADDSDERAVALLAMLKRSYQKKVPLKSVIRKITAFTHGRRIEIVRLLMERPRGFAELMDESNMTSSALSRGLLKLQGRQMVSRKGRRYYMEKPTDELGRALLSVVCQKKT
jgi:DNA-binding transcriptional ArsR family regulator